MKNRILSHAALLACATVFAVSSGAEAASKKKAAKSVAAPKPAAEGTRDNQAVSAPNATLDVSGGIMDGYGTGAIAAIGDIPLGDKYGAQLDTLYRQSASVNAGGVGGHLFYRDPTSYLAGATALWYNVEGRNVYRYGVETEWYEDQFTFAPAAGFQRSKSNNGTVGYYDVGGSYYATDNLKFTAKGTGFKGTHGGAGEVAWQPEDNRPMVVYVNVGDSNISKARGMVGLRFNFGAPASSMQHRDRYADPQNILNPLDGVLGNSPADDDKYVAPGIS